MLRYVVLQEKVRQNEERLKFGEVRLPRKQNDFNNSNFQILTILFTSCIAYFLS